MPPLRAKSSAAKRPARRKSGVDPLSRGPVDRVPSESGTRLPHERDEMPARASGSPDSDTRQAYKDIEAGQMDTDLRGKAVRIFEKAGKKRAKRKPKPGT
jgi:hypothetical protein